jgi:hypothetical protein
MRGALFVIGMFGAGLVGAVAGRFLWGNDEAPPADRAPDAALETRLAEVEARVAELREEVRRPPDLSAALASPPAEGAPRDDATSAPEPTAAAPTVPEAEIEEKVREVVEERAAAEREARERRAAAIQIEKDRAFLGRLQEALGITDFQREELGRHLTARRAALEEYKQRLTEYGPDITTGQRDAARQRLTDWVADQDVELKALLGVDTFDKLMKITSPDRGRGGGR